MNIHLNTKIKENDLVEHILKTMKGMFNRILQLLTDANGTQASLNILVSIE